jgi:hypothetical protein
MPLRLPLTLALAAGSMAFAPPLQAATVTVVHGVPGFRADVYVNGKKALTGFQAGAMTTPIHLPAGRYHLAIRPAGASPNSTPVLAATVTLTGSENASVVAHLNAQGKPMISLYRNNVAPIAMGHSRLTFRQVAAAPPVDVLVNGKTLFRNVPNSAERTAIVSSHTYSVAVVSAGTKHRIWGAASVSVRPAQIYIAYAVGSTKKGSVDQLVQQIRDPAPTPTRVQAGDSGLAAPAGNGQWWTAVAEALAALALATGALITWRTRARRISS